MGRKKPGMTVRHFLVPSWISLKVEPFTLYTLKSRLLFVGVDPCTLEGIGIQATRRATRFEAGQRLRRGAAAVCPLLGRHRDERAGAA